MAPKTFKGLYIWSLSPYRLRAFAGFPRECSQLVKLHWKGSLYCGLLGLSLYSIIQHVNTKEHLKNRKDEQFYEDEAKRLTDL